MTKVTKPLDHTENTFMKNVKEPILIKKSKG